MYNQGNFILSFTVLYAFLQSVQTEKLCRKKQNMCTNHHLLRWQQTPYKDGSLNLCKLEARMYKNELY